MPRTVCTSSGLAGSCSIFRRRRLTCTSTARSPVPPRIAGEREPRHGLARRRRQEPEHVALAVGQMDDLVAALELAARDVEDEIAEAHDFDRRGAAGRVRLRMLAIRNDSSRGSNGLPT